MGGCGLHCMRVPVWRNQRHLSVQRGILWGLLASCTPSLWRLGRIHVMWSETFLVRGSILAGCPSWHHQWVTHSGTWTQVDWVTVQCLCYWATVALYGSKCSFLFCMILSVHFTNWLYVSVCDCDLQQVIITLFETFTSSRNDITEKTDKKGTVEKNSER